MSEDHSSTRGFDPEPLDLACSVELDPNIVELDVHGTNGMEDWNGVEDYGMQGSGIRDNHLEDNDMQDTRTQDDGMEDNDMGDDDMGDNRVEDNGTDDTTVDDYLAGDASLNVPSDDISRALERLADERRPTKQRRWTG
jgi:hypothetical protein